MSSRSSGTLKATRNDLAPNHTTDPSSSNDNKQDAHSRDAGGSLTGIGAAAAHATLPSWMNVVLMVSLIFGGCCANVFALEAIIKEEPRSGPLITFVQFIVTALFTLPNFISIPAGPRSLFIAKRVIPLRSWLVYTAFFLTINLLNNWAFAYKISVPLHIIVRSGGPVASMIIGYLFNGKRYSRGQVVAVILLTLGVVGAALADAEARGQSMNIETDSNSHTIANTVTGFSILALAMILSAFQGIFADRLYERHGRNNWKEALFYSHALSLPLFLTSYPQLLSQWRTLLSSPPLLSKISAVSSFTSINLGGISATTPLGVLSIPASVSGVISSLALVIQRHQFFQSFLARVPIQVVYLFTNALTQFLCIRGVHLLAAKTSSLTVTIVLNIRKLVSLLLSIYLFGNQLAPGVLVGAALVFAGGGLYGFEGTRLREKSLKKD
ncbi:hypothetical protein SI65_08771 [Aspergillus cristatus]|uniref:UDP-N-acetylglucosamine transporter yea4 n=1 Tax=Aspergillus cristatus TaxID=573508 RepID=A0A1E3B4N8_ASPCR|nr:hypothetical protein SI65_08771 [Aspergillus cristatus]